MIRRKIFETLKERYDECMEHKHSMIIYDFDSLIGVNQSESQSSIRTDREEKQYKQEQRREKELIKCRDVFIESENQMGNCTYHDEFVYDNSFLELTKYTSTKMLQKF